MPWSSASTFLSVCLYLSHIDPHIATFHASVCLNSLNEKYYICRVIQCLHVSPHANDFAHEVFFLVLNVLLPARGASLCVGVHVGVIHLGAKQCLSSQKQSVQDIKLTNSMAPETPWSQWICSQSKKCRPSSVPPKAVFQTLL
jgi:hypothetical protein